MDDQVIGFLSLVLYRSFFHRKGTALVNELVVKKEFRNQQIGKALLEHAFSVATEAGMDELEVGVMKENTHALTFYRKNGFGEEYLLLGKEFSVKG
jgi:ribosomal protein S18 acetylase RimI-like enzyme